MKKKGISHIEIIISFLLFIWCVVFALYFFNPGNTTRLTDSSLEYVMREVKNNVSIDIESYSIVINKAESIMSDIVLQVNISSIANNKKVQVLDGNGTAVNCNRSDSIVYFNLSDNFFGGKDTPKIMFAEDFNDTQQPSGNIVNWQYKISSFEKMRVISEKRFLILNKTYSASYDELKKNFNIPNRVGMGFKLVLDSGKEIEAQRKVPDTIEVYTNSERVRVLKENGEIENGELIVKVW